MSTLYDSPLFVKSVEKAFAVLHVFGHNTEALTLAAIAERAELDRSATQRFVYTLHVLGYLIKDDATRAYKLSPRLLEIGYAYLESDPVISFAQQHLTELHRLTGETVNLAKLDGTDIILISRFPSQKIVSVNIKLGSRLPGLYTASGRVLIAHKSAEERQRIVRESAMRAYTSFSIVDRDELLAELDRVRRNGYCVARSQQFEGDLSIAAPVRESSGAVIACVSVGSLEFGGPNKVRETELVEAVIAAATATSRALGATI